MATMTSRLFARDTQTAVDEEQLLRLFWNRAELKKELEALEKEKSELEEQAGQKDALMLRVQQRLNHLEALLSDPASAPAVVTYYQLRGIWGHCNRILQSLATELRRSSHDRAYQKFVESQQDKQAAVMKDIQQQYSVVSDECEELAVRVRELRDQRKANSGLFGLMRRKHITAELNVLREERRRKNAQLEQLAEQKSELAVTSGEEFGGLDVAAKRRINLVVIAYAQQLVLFFQDHHLTKLAREASLNQVNDVQYGSRRDCRQIRQHLAERLRELPADKSLKQQVELRSRFLATQVEYRCDTDAVPMAASLGSLALLDAKGEKYNELSLNILADEYWDLFAVLLS